MNAEARIARAERGGGTEAPPLGGEREAPPTQVVVVGFSPARPEPLRELLAEIPSGLGIAVLAVPLEGEVRAKPAKHLRARTALDVIEARGDVPVVADRVHLVPARSRFVYEGGRLRRSRVPRPGARPTAVDELLRSLGREIRERSVGVLLDGEADEGLLGLRDVKWSGGLAVYAARALSRRGARWIEGAAHADPLDSPAAIVAAIAHRARRSPANATALESLCAKGPFRDEIDRLLDVYPRFGVTRYDGHLLARRLWSRMSLVQIDRAEDYLDLLRREPWEAGALADDLVLRPGGFFRDPAWWNLVEEHVVAVLVERARDGEPIRAWCPGSSTGEEAYSLAILLLEALEQAGKRCPVQLFASDVGSRDLAFARARTYRASQLGDLSGARRRRYFQRTDCGPRVVDELRDAVVFAEHDLSSDPPYSKLALVCCRDLLAGFRPEIRDRLVGLLAYGLEEGGHLVLGSTDRLPDDLEGSFRELAPRTSLYRRAGHSPRGFASAAFATLRRPATRSAASTDPPPGDPLWATSRHMSERIAELERQNRRLAFFLSCAEMPMLLVDDRLRLKRFTPAMTRILPVGPSDVGRSVEEIAKTATADLANDVRHALADLVPVDREIGLGNGTWIRRRALASPAEPEQTALVAVTFSDVTDRRNAEERAKSLRRDRTRRERSWTERLHSTESHMHAIFEAVADAIFMLDEDGRVVECNPTGARLFGYERDDLVGRSSTELLASPYRQRNPREIRRLLEAPDGVFGQTREVVGVRRNGSTFPLEVVLATTRDRTRGFVTLVARDLTERKQWEADERMRHAALAHALRMTTMGELATGIAHELNQPLAAMANGIATCVNLVRDGSTAEVVTRELDRVADDVQRAAEILRGFRDFIERRNVRSEVIDVRVLARRAAALLQSELAAHQVDLVLELGRRPLQVRGDRVLLEQIVLNLVQNAIEASVDVPLERRRIEISVERRRHAARLVVLDHGEGLTPEAREHAFDPFFTTKASGLGMGLAISRSLAEANGGHLALASRDGGGSGVTASLRLPLHEARA